MGEILKCTREDGTTFEMLALVPPGSTDFWTGLQPKYLLEEVTVLKDGKIQFSCYHEPVHGRYPFSNESGNQQKKIYSGWTMGYEGSILDDKRDTWKLWITKVSLVRSVIQETRESFRKAGEIRILVPPPAGTNGASGAA